MIKITFEDFFKSKEVLGIIVKNMEDVKEIQRQSIKVTGKNKYHWVEEGCCMLKMLDKGIALTNNGFWVYLAYKTYKKCNKVVLKRNIKAP